MEEENTGGEKSSDVVKSRSDDRMKLRRDDPPETVLAGSATTKAERYPGLANSDTGEQTNSEDSESEFQA